MTTPNMATITAALERSLQNCSLSSSPSSAHSPRPPNRRHDETPASSLELNSHLALPYEWEQCLDLKVARNAHLSLINATLFFFWWLVFKAHVKILSFLICHSFITLLALLLFPLLMFLRRPIRIYKHATREKGMYDLLPLRYGLDIIGYLLLGINVLCF